VRASVLLFDIRIWAFCRATRQLIGFFRLFSAFQKETVPVLFALNRAATVRERASGARFRSVFGKGISNDTIAQNVIVFLTCLAIALAPGCRNSIDSKATRSAAGADTQLACAQCAQARLENKWCDACKIGYVAGVPIKSKLLFEGLDAHGHTVVLSTFTCSSCKSAIAEQGFCEKCRTGFLGNQAYFSRLTYELAHGRSVTAESLSCPVCRKNHGNHNWCDKCRLGIVGNTVLNDRRNFDAAVRPYEIMLVANDAAARCEMCALAIITDTRCFVCKLDYKDGKAAPAKPRP
jgi:hypothetical protein